MKKTDEMLEKIYNRVVSLEPPVKKIGVSCNDMEMNMMFLDLDRVCYLTTRSDTGRVEIMIVTDDGKRYYNNRTLDDVGKGLSGHPHFMRSSRFYIINLRKITGLKFSNARDLWFEGSAEPVRNIVTETYREEFERRFEKV